jgi:pimeloyl-ACP methyl ester carboxylesterase
MRSAGARRRVRVSGGELALVDLGDPDAPAVLFVHGVPTSSHLWRALVPAFAPSMRAIAPDLLGAGDSDKPTDRPLGVRSQAEYLAEVLDQRGIGRVAVVGHGHGASIALLLALHGRAEALVLIDAIIGSPWPSGPLSETGPDAVADGGAAVERSIRLGLAHPERLPADVLAEYRGPFDGEAGGAALARLSRALDEPAPFDEKDLAALDVPALVLWGEDDALAPVSTAERLNDLLVRSSLALLPGCGHFLPEEAPNTVAPLLYEYLRGRYAGLPHLHHANATPIELGRRVGGGD